MSDIALRWNGSSADLVIGLDDLATDDGLETAVLLALFLDRRAEDSDELPAQDVDRRGWWADGLGEFADDRFGSKLWLRTRSKQNEGTRLALEGDSREALQWMLDDRVASAVEAAAVYPAPGRVDLLVTIRRPSGDAVSFRFNRNWESML
jgi:phage gp46-like protein